LQGVEPVEFKLDHVQPPLAGRILSGQPLVLRTPGPDLPLDLAAGGPDVGHPLRFGDAFDVVVGQDGHVLTRGDVDLAKDAPVNSRYTSSFADTERYRLPSA
jgi:hypothetical protein